MGTLPVDQLFAKGRLDLWVAQAWMDGDPPELVQKIVELSVASGATGRAARAGRQEWPTTVGVSPARCAVRHAHLT
jgi:hypothetical protein